jgi:hypothetical protein
MPTNRSQATDPATVVSTPSNGTGRFADVGTNSGGDGAPATAPATPLDEQAGAESTDPAADAMKLLHEWLVGITIEHVGHTRAAVVYDRRAKILGVAATLISAVIGTTLFSAIASSTNSTLIAAAGLLSVAAVILSALQTFLGYGQLAATHHAAAISYGALRRRVELITVFRDSSGLREQMPVIAAAWTKLGENSPDLPLGIYEYARKWVSGRKNAVRAPVA